MKSRKSGTSKTGKTNQPKDQLPKFLYDQIPSEITNESAFKSKIKGDDKNSPYAFAKQSTSKTVNKASPKLNLKVDTSLDSLEPKKSSQTHDNNKTNSNNSNKLNVPLTSNGSLDRGPSPIYDRVSQKMNNILSSTDLAIPIPSSSPNTSKTSFSASKDELQISEIESSDYGQPKDAELSFTSSKSLDPKPGKSLSNTQDSSFNSFHDFSFSDGSSAVLVNTPQRPDNSNNNSTSIGSITPHPYRVAASKKISGTPVSQSSQPSQYSPASINSANRRTSNTHSNSSSISHASTSQPSYWNIDNVRQFLLDNRFNDSWIDVIVGKNLVHEAFLKLQNYEILKTYIPFLDTTGESTPSRFIQQLRKTLERQSSLNSITNQTVFSVPLVVEENEIPSPRTGVVETVDESDYDDNSSLKDLESIASSNISNFKEDIGILDNEVDDSLSLRTIGEKLVPVVSAPTLTSSVHQETKAPAKTMENLNTLSRRKVTKPRPVSTIERSSFSTISPTVSKSFFKRHNKSTSSESTTLNSIPVYDHSSSSSSSTDIPNGYKKHSRASSKGSIKIDDAATPKGIFNKFFSKSKLGDIPYSLTRGTDSPVSPSSYFTLGNSSPDLIKKESKVMKSQRKPPPDLDSLKSPARSSSSAKVVPKFEKIGPVGKKPQPAGATIPVKTSAPSVTKTSSITPTSGKVPAPPQQIVSGPPDVKLETKIMKDAKSPGSSLTSITSLDSKFQPVIKADASVKYILVTTNNFSFIPVNVGFIQSSVALKALLIKSLGIKLSSEVTFHLTDFGAEPGMALDDEALDLIIRTGFLNGKCLISVKQKSSDTLAISSVSARPSSKSISDSLNSETLSDRGYPNTPQYLLSGTNLKHKESIDYMNFKDQFTPISENVTHNELRDYIAQKDFVLNSIKDNNGSTNSFRVIRPEKREIDFDKRRDSPFTVNLAPQRTPPPPPPLSSNSSIKSLKNSPRKLNRKPPPSNADDTSSLSSSSEISVKGSLKKSGVSLSKSRIKRKVSMKQAFDPFKEYDLDSTIVNSFGGFGNYEEIMDDVDDDDDDDSDDGLFAKAPASNDNTLLSRDAPSTGSSTNSSTMEVRPPPEVLYDNLERYFPNTDLDELIIDEVVTPPVSPVKEEAVSVAHNVPPLPERPKPAESAPNSLQVPIEDSKRSGKIHRMKSIRIVVQEATRKSSMKHAAKGDTHPKNGNGMLLRRTSTKMWGQRVVEVTPGTAKSHYVNQLKNQNGQFKEFAWVKGELIGVGTFGKVYLALNVTTGEMIAVKQTTVSSKFINKRETTKIIDTFKAEVDSLKDLDHVNIVQYLGFEMKDNTYSIFLEYVSGGSVGSCINTYGKFPENLIKFLTEQILQGLHYIHSRGILHRDLKADNLLLEVDGNCKISDFGISKKTKDIYVNDSALSFQGTVFWMAPEVVNNTVHKGYNAKVDIWSLGCVVLQMYTGERPWQDIAIPTAILNLGKNAAPPIPKETLDAMSEDGKDFLKKCFEIDPEKRPTAMELLKHPFGKADPGFKFADTELAQKMKFANTLEEKRAKMISVNRGKS